MFHMNQNLKVVLAVESVDLRKSFNGLYAVACCELGDFKRFDHPKKLMAYLGLVPTEDSSGGKRRQGGITKCGNSHARWMLVECAGHYKNPPKISKALSKRQEGLSRELSSYLWDLAHIVD